MLPIIHNPSVFFVVVLVNCFSIIISIHPSGSLQSGIGQLQPLLIGTRHKDKGKGPDKETRAKAQGTRTKDTKAARDQGSRDKGKSPDQGTRAKAQGKGPLEADAATNDLSPGADREEAQFSQDNKEAKENRSTANDHHSRKAELEGAQRLLGKVNDHGK